MKRWLLFALSIAALQAAPVPLFRISGVLVNEQTNQPIKHALVSITQTEHRDRTASLYTAADGRFTFTDVPTGKYELEASVRGVQRLLDQADDNFSTAVVTGPGLDSENIVFRFPVLGSIGLKLQDDQGDSVTNAQAYLYSERVRMGRREMLLVNQSGTGSDGTLHLPHVESGSYYLAVYATPWYAQNMAMMPNASSNEEEKAFEVAYPLTFYPNSSSPDGAGRIAVGPGEKVNLQMTLHAVPSIRILLDGANDGGEPRRGMPQSFVEAMGPGGSHLMIPASPYQQPDGTVGILGLAPGNYIVSLSRFHPRRAPEAMGTVHVNATSDVHVSFNDMPHTSVSGKLMLDPPGSFAGIALWLNEVSTGNTALCRADAKGDFTCREGRGMGGTIEPGRYAVNTANLSDYYLKSLSVQGGQYENGLLNVAENATVTLAAVVSKGLTKLNGTALLNNKPLAGAMVLLVPRDAQSGFVIGRDQSDSDGTFSILNARPGHFYLLALDHGRDLPYYDSRVLAPYLENAQKIDITGPSTQPVKVNVQARRP